MFKKIIFNLILFFMLFVAFFSVGEICFRIFRGPPNHLAKITQTDGTTLLKPNLVEEKSSSVEGEFKYTAKINSHGYRGAEFKMPKDPKTIRILAVGDSFTFGVGAEEDETIPYLLEQKLKTANKNIEVINAGAGHTSPAHHYLNFKNIHLNYQPDLVLLLFDLTDLRDDWYVERHGIFDKNGDLLDYDPTYLNGKKNWWITSMKYSAFCEWTNRKVVRSFRKIQTLGIKEYIRAIIEGKKVKALIANSTLIKNEKIEYDGLLMLRGKQQKELIDYHFKRTAKYLTKIKNLLEKENIPMVLVMYPHGIFVGKDQWSQGRASWGFEENKHYTDTYGFDILQDFADQNEIITINALDDFLMAEEKKYFFDYDGHLNPDGNRIVANSITANPVLREMLNNL